MLQFGKVEGDMIAPSVVHHMRRDVDDLHVGVLGEVVTHEKLLWARSGIWGSVSV